MKGNKQIFSNRKADRVKGYKKLFNKQKDHYDPPKQIAKDLVEAMQALGHDITLQEAMDYLRSSYAVHDRKYYLTHIKNG
jgi:acid phosphatase class B